MTRKLFLAASVVLFSAGIAQADRFTIDDVGATETPRALIKTNTVTTTLNDAGGLGVYTAGAGATDAKGVQVIYQAPLPTTLDGATLIVKSGKVGLVESTAVDFGLATKKGLLVPPAAGDGKGVYLPAKLSYSINFLERRKIKITNSAITTLTLSDNITKVKKLLAGAVIDTTFNVATTNKAAVLLNDSATHVRVAAGGQTFGEMNVTQKDIDDNSTSHQVAVSGTITAPLIKYQVKNKVTGMMEDVLGPDGKNIMIRNSGKQAATGYLTVNTLDTAAGDTDMTDTKDNYPSQKVSYSFSGVGLAKATTDVSKKLVGKKFVDKLGVTYADYTNDPMNDFGDPHKATVNSLWAKVGSIPTKTNVNLSSGLAIAGTLADQTKAGKDGTIKGEDIAWISYVQAGKQNSDGSWPDGKWSIGKLPDGKSSQTLKGLYGLVGSEAEIYSMQGTTGGDVSMLWRARTAAEAHMLDTKTATAHGSAVPFLGGGLPQAGEGTPGGLWLTSDVVKIGGSAIDSLENQDTIYYALQMTFDNRINLSLDGPTSGAIENSKLVSYIAQLKLKEEDGTALGWERVGVGTGNWESLAEFLAANADLSAVEGAWGVDPVKVDGTAGTYKSWAIVKGGGSGVFAVVPEPATVIMMISASLGAMAYGWRRWSRKSQESLV